MEKQKKINVGASFVGIPVRHDTTVPGARNHKNKGITLISLVITIIVLLILAGITLSLTIGQNGIINMAQQAGKNQIDAEQKEQEELDKLYGYMNGYMVYNRRYK